VTYLWFPFGVRLRHPKVTGIDLPERAVCTQTRKERVLT
jgi:hypothetical protein